MFNFKMIYLSLARSSSVGKEKIDDIIIHIDLQDSQ